MGPSMPPVQPSLRGSLLTGASVVTLSVSASGAHAQNVHPGAAPSVPAPAFVWVEGALFQPSPGGSFNIQSIPGLGAPYTAFNPLNGIEGAFGFDYQPSQQPWHFIFDFRYGRTRTTAA